MTPGILRRLVVAIGWTVFVPIWVAGVLVLTLLMPFTYIITDNPWTLADLWFPLVLGRADDNV